MYVYGVSVHAYDCFLQYLQPYIYNIKVNRQHTTDYVLLYYWLWCQDNYYWLLDIAKCLANMLQLYRYDKIMDL